MDEQNRTAIIYDAQRKLLAANYEMAEIRSLLNELMALEEMEEVISLAIHCRGRVKNQPSESVRI